MTSMRRAENVNLFNGGTMTVTANGGTLEQTFDPKLPLAVVQNAGELQNFEAIELRKNGSDVVISGQTVQAEVSGFDARAAHYARYNGEVSVTKNGKTEGPYRVAGYQNGVFTLDAGKESQKRVDTSSDVTIGWGAVKEPWREMGRSILLEMENVEGKDEVKLTAQIASRSNVEYRLILADSGDAFDQHNLKVQMFPLASISNNTQVALENMALKLVLNEPRSYAMPEAAMRSVAYNKSAPADESASEGGVSGVKSLLAMTGGLSIDKGQSKKVSFASALVGKPDGEAKFIELKLNQDLKVSIPVSYDREEGAKSTFEASPKSLFTLACTKEARPAGVYRIYDEGQLAGPAYTPGEYTRADEDLKLPGNEFRDIKASVTTTTVKFTEGTWAPAAQPKMMRPTKSTSEEATHTYSMQVAVELESKSSVSRDTDLVLRVDQFSEGVKNIKATSNGATLKVTYNKEEGTLTLNAPVAKGSTSKVEITFEGFERETREV